MKLSHNTNNRFLLSLAFLLTLTLTSIVTAQTTEFTYQGKLSDTGTPLATYDFEFRLFAVETGGAALATQQKTAVSVSNGSFTVQLDFGAAHFNGSSRWLETAVKRPSEAAFTTLAPRQKLTSAPFSIRSEEANSADGLTSRCVGCVESANINSVAGGKVTGTVANAASADNVSGVVSVANGGTGSATQNFVDLSTNQIVGGNKTFSGTVGAASFSGNGANLTNVFQIRAFGGQIGGIMPTGGSFVFPGNHALTLATITVNGNQRITGSVSAALGFSSGTNFIDIGLCYQRTSAGAVTPFSSNFMSVTVNSTRLTYTVSESVVLPAGEYRVGFCIATGSRFFSGDNGALGGWVMITNN